MALTGQGGPQRIEEDNWECLHYQFERVGLFPGCGGSEIFGMLVIVIMGTFR